MGFCSRCGAEIADGNLYCSACGTKLKVVSTPKQRLWYEKGVETHYSETSLLFQRFNFLMVGMSLLVAAFVALTI